MPPFATTTKEPAERSWRGRPAALPRPPAGLSIPDDEWQFIQEAAAPELGSFAPERPLSSEVIRSLTHSCGVDHATAAIYAWLLESLDHGNEIKAFFAAAAAGPCSEAIRAATAQLTVFIVPGAFYEEYPQTGAGGESLMRELESLEVRVRRIPTLSTGTLEQNTAIVGAHLRENATHDSVIVSLSRGGAEIKCLMRDDPECLRHVSLWVSIGGILTGSPLINWVRKRWMIDWLNWLVFRCRGRDYRCFTELARGAEGSLDFDAHLPNHLRAIHVIGFPLRRHVTSRYARAWHRRFAAQGPNDGVMLLEDVLGHPGLILPLWAADHYVSDRWDFRFLLAGILRHWFERTGGRREMPDAMEAP
jgi:hypothetical protein